MSLEPRRALETQFERLFTGFRMQRDGESPLYYQLEQHLRTMLRAGVVKVGQSLPTEAEIQKHFGISRVTVRQAMENLVRDGLICRCRGRGTQVNPPKIEVELLSLGSFTDAMESRGYRVRTKVTVQEMVLAGDEIASALMVNLGEQVWHLERVRMVNDEQIVHFESYLPRDANLDPKARVDSLYQHLRQMGLEVTHTDESIEAVIADGSLAGKLRVRSGSALLRRVRHGRLQSGRCVEYTIGHYRGDRYRYHLRLGRAESMAEPGDPNPPCSTS